jgi:hypothetical protein
MLQLSFFDIENQLDKMVLTIFSVVLMIDGQVQAFVGQFF